MKPRFVRWPSLLWIGLFALACGATGARDARGDPLDETIAVALGENPGVRAARAEWNAAREVAPQAGSLPDPMLTYGAFLQEVETRVGPQKQRVGVSQAIPWFGTLGLRRDRADAAAEAARSRYERTILDVTRQVKSAYADYYAWAATLSVARDNLELLRSWERILSARYATGGAAYGDLIQVQVEMGRLEDRIASLEDQRSARIARLNALMNRPADSEIPVPESLPEDPLLPSRAALEQAAGESNPDLQSLRAMVRAEEHGIALARKAYYPDFTLGVDWIQTDPRDVQGLEDNGKDPVVGMLMVRVPFWWGKRTAATREAESRRESAEARLADRSRMIEADLADLLFRHADAERKISLYAAALIPKARQSLDAAYAAFEGGKADFLKVLDAQRALLEFELSLEQARADRLRSRAAIDALRGQRSHEG